MKAKKGHTNGPFDMPWAFDIRRTRLLHPSRSLRTLCRLFYLVVVAVSVRWWRGVVTCRLSKCST